MAPPDSRREVGGIVWAKAEAVSKDAKRIYGAGISDKWIMGTVIEVLSQKKSQQSNRATTYVRASYKIGDTTKEKLLSLQSLKPQEPKKQPTADMPLDANNNANPPANGGTNPPSTNGNGTTTTTTTTAVAATGDTPPAPPADSAMPPLAPPLAPPRPPGPTAVAHAHGRDWFDGNDIHSEINGPTTVKHRKMVCQHTGNECTLGCDSNMNRLKYTEYDCFMACFPKDQLMWMVEELNRQLPASNHEPTSVGELLKWFGILILMTRFEYGDRSSLWSTQTKFKYIPPPAFGRTGMTRDRFEDMFRCMRWSEQPQERPEGMSSETYRWMAVDDFVSRYNHHRVQHFQPSDIICVDESMSRWYGIGGTWINAGLPFYVAIDRKPEDGCEIQNSCCGKSNIMMRLKIVKSPSQEDNS